MQSKRYRFKFADGSYAGTDWHDEQTAIEARQDHLDLVVGNPSSRVQDYAARYAAAELVEIDRETHASLLFDAMSGVIGVRSTLILAGAKVAA